MRAAHCTKAQVQKQVFGDGLKFVGAAKITEFYYTYDSKYVHRIPYDY